MTIVTGCDLVDVERLSRVIDRREGFLARVFTDRELADARRAGAEAGSAPERERLAARFAAKEATRKALRDGRLGHLEVEVRTEDDGAPVLWIRGTPSDLAVSLAHDGGMALATVTGLVD